MKKMTSKHDYHTYPTPDGIYVSIHQEDKLRQDYGPFRTQREANRAAHNQWRRQVADNATTFADRLKLVKGRLTAKKLAAAVSPIISVRTVENWLQGKAEPEQWTQPDILARVKSAAEKK